MIHNITICPTCGSKNIKRVRRKITREYKGEEFSVPAVQFHECPDCGERVFSPDAVRKILSRSPANNGKNASGRLLNNPRRQRIKITSCPTCESKNIRKVRRNLKRKYKGGEVIIPSVSFYECPDCGERLFDREAMRKIESHHPVYKEAPAAKRLKVS